MHARTPTRTYTGYAGKTQGFKLVWDKRENLDEAICVKKHFLLVCVCRGVGRVQKINAEI